MKPSRFKKKWPVTWHQSKNVEAKRKIINDPVFGFINLPTGFLYEVYQHRYLQRLSRIKQLGMSPYVYPGA